MAVLQKNGIESPEGLEAYISWAAHKGVSEICFKELYVSSSQESVYYSRNANKWSFENQISLKLVLDFVEKQGWKETQVVIRFWIITIFLVVLGLMTLKLR